MANDEHVAILKKGVADWNAWRYDNPRVRPDLSKMELSGGWTLPGANLRNADLSEADLSDANLSQSDLSMATLRGANLSRAILVAPLALGSRGAAVITGHGADLRGADLTGAFLMGAMLRRADLSGADLSRAYLQRATLYEANFSGAKLINADLFGAALFASNLSNAILRHANLKYATLAKTDFTGADLSGCRVYGVSAWDLKFEKTKQENLVITDPDEGKPEITVDNIEVAQFIYLLLHNEKIRDVIDTIGKKGVLLLGRFTEGRIEVLERLRDKLRDLGFVPMVFNFDKPETKDFSETVRLLCSLSKFVIVDITNPRSAPLELQATVPDYMVPFVPILQQGEDPFAMFVDLQNKYDWVLKPVKGYSSVDRLIEALEEKIVRPAEAKFNELLARRTQQLRVENV